MPARLSPRNRAKRGAKNSRSAERGCSSVHPPPNRRRMGGGSNLVPPPTGYRRAIARSAVQKQPERRARMFLCYSAAEQAANGWRQQPCPTTNRLSPRNRAKRGAKTAGAQSKDVPLFTRRRTGGEWVKKTTWPYCWGEQQTPHHHQQAIATPRKVGT